VKQQGLEGKKKNRRFHFGDVGQGKRSGMPQKSYALKRKKDEKSQKNQEGRKRAPSKRSIVGKGLGPAKNALSHARMGRGGGC